MLFVLDASAVLNDFGFEFKKQHSYIAPNLVLMELLDLRSRSLAENALKRHALTILDPSALFLQKAASIANSLECRGLSQADLAVLALAMELKEQGKKSSLVTDDHSLQVVCKAVGIAFEPVIRGTARAKKKKSKKYLKNPN